MCLLTPGSCARPPEAQFLWATCNYNEHFWTEDSNAPNKKTHTEYHQVLAATMYFGWLRRWNKTRSPRTVTPSRMFHILWTGINIEAQLWRRDSNAALPKSTVRCFFKSCVPLSSSEIFYSAFFFKRSAQGGAWTHDPGIKSPMLYQLS